MKLAPYITVLLLSITGIAHGESANIKKINLKEAIGIAFNNNNRIKSAGYSVKAAEEQSVISHLSYYPTIAFEESFSASNAPTQAFMMKLDQGRFAQNDFQINNLNNPTTQHDFKTSLTLRQPLYDPAASANRSLAGYEANKSLLLLDAGKESVAFQIFQQNLIIKKAAAHLQATREALKEADENLRLATVRNNAGTGIKSDELRARTDRFSRELENHTAENNLAIARMRLAVLLGITEPETFEIINDYKTLPSAINRENLLAAATAKRKDLQILREEKGKSAAALARSRSMYYPSLAAVASYQLNGKNSPFENDNNSWIAGINLSWQLFDGFKRYHQQSSAIALRSAAEEALEQAIKEVSLQIDENIIRYHEAEKRVYVARNSVSDADETVRLIKKRFENSLATMLELLDAQTILNRTRSNLADAEADHILAAGQVYYSAGIFLKEFVQ